MRTLETYIDRQTVCKKYTGGRRESISIVFVARVAAREQIAPHPHRVLPVAMAVTAEEVVKAYEKAKEASDDAEGNTASEDRCVDCLASLARMSIPLKLFTTGALGEVPKAIKKLAKKGPTDKVRAAAQKCVDGWMALMTGGVAKPADAPAADEAPNERDDEKANEKANGGADENSKNRAKEDDKEKEDVAHDDGSEASLKQLLGPELGDPLRDRTRELLAEALVLCVGESGVYASRLDCAATATAVERAMANKWTDVGKEYKAKFRQLAFNLKDPKNPDLRAQVADGLIDPVSLLELAPEQLASAERRTENEAIREHATNEAVRGQKKEASTDAFKCGKCKQRKCTYYQLQTRSADEPMTTFVTCVNCDNRWKFC